MPFLTIGKHDYDRSWTSPGPRGTARLFRHEGSPFEISEELAALAREEAPAFVRITDTDPGLEDAARRGPLTRNEIDMGTRAADEKARADRLAAEVDRLTVEANEREQPAAGESEPEDPFFCNFCDERYPTEAARDRHEEMQHVDTEPEPDPAPDSKPAPKRAPRKAATK